MAVSCLVVSSSGIQTGVPHGIFLVKCVYVYWKLALWTRDGLGGRAEGGKEGSA